MRAAESSPLTSKQKRWVDEYCRDLNAAAASVRAGYSAKCAGSIGHENLNKPDIAAAVRVRQAALAEKLEIRRVDVVKNLLQAHEMAREDRNPAAMIAALVTIAKILGLYQPEVKRVELSVGLHDVQERMEAMTDKQLLAVIASGGAVSA